MHAAYTLQMTGFCLHWHLQATQSSRPTVIVFLPHIQHICIDMSGEHEKCTCSLVPSPSPPPPPPPPLILSHSHGDKSGGGAGIEAMHNWNKVITRMHIPAGEDRNRSILGKLPSPPTSPSLRCFLQLLLMRVVVE